MGYTELSQLPAKEADIWEAAHVGDDGKQRQVTRQLAGLGSTAWATVEQFLGEVDNRLKRWRDGHYEIIEAAQIVADSNPTINAQTFRKQMEGAAYSGALTLRENGVSLKADALQRGGVWNMQVRQDDVNKWLQSDGAGFELAYPYPDNEPQAAPAQQAGTEPAPVVPVVALSQVLPKKSKRDLLTPAIEAAQRNAPDPHDAAAIWLVLRGLAEKGVKPFLGVTEGGLQWKDHNDNPQFLTLKNLRDRINRKPKKPR
jgi:hypothetical protein